MSNILLIEPNYKNKYPPLGLMKLSFFHKYILNDYVRFAKGSLPVALSNTKWDKVYVTTLFTYEWNETIRTIKYALTLVNDPSCVIVGGISATLMSNKVFKETGIKPISGLLDAPNQLGFNHDEIIDQMTPDYSILDDVSDSYVYPYHDAYFLSATKGCGMKCGFCAVQTLEPNYIPYIDIKPKVTDIIDRYGPKRDLLLMDNNVLRSRRFHEIIDDILELGFEKDATFINPKSGKRVKRSVDFNQGLDANLMTPEKAKRLGEIALKPARIAFDHIEDRETYERAVRLCAENGITYLSNYTLYNSEDFSGKGNSYGADTPEDLFIRMRVTLDLKNDLNRNLQDDEKISIFSFPMRYIPLTATERGYVGSKWNAKFLRAVQCMLIPTQGKGVGNQSFFEADFGTDADMFVKYLCMPEKLIAARGHFAIGGRGRIEETPSQIEERKRKWDINQARIKEWNRLFSQLGKEKESFISKIGDNEFLPEKLLGLNSDLQKKLYIHYLTEPRILVLLAKTEKSSPTRTVIYNYIKNEFPIIYEGLVTLIAFNSSQKQYMFINFIEFFGYNGVSAILKAIELCDFDVDKQLAVWAKASKKSGISYVDFELIRIYRRFVDLSALTDEDHVRARKAIIDADMLCLGSILYDNLRYFEHRLSSIIEQEKGEKIIKETTETILNNIQLKLFQFSGESNE